MAFSRHLEGIPIAWNYALYGLALLTAGMTAFYMFRALLLTFFGESRLDAHVAEHVHESPKLMTVPLLVLALLSIVGGLVGVPAAIGGGAHFAAWLAPVVGHEVAGEGEHALATLEIGLMGLSVLVALTGIVLAVIFYGRRTGRAERFVAAWPRLHQTVWNKYYVDEFNDAAVINPLKRVATNFLWLFVDAAVIDGAVNGVAATAKQGGALFARLQSGRVHTYALAITIGAVVLLGLMLWRA
jgi:NADH-quinone oxidoreductase subunit L